MLQICELCLQCREHPFAPALHYSRLLHMSKREERECEVCSMNLRFNSLLTAMNERPVAIQTRKDVIQPLSRALTLSGIDT